jgi:hypothetical protein
VVYRPGKCIGDGVEIRRNIEAEKFFIVSSVDNDGEMGRVNDAHKPA